MPQYLKPMVWPAAVPLLTPWQGDYADIRDRVRRDSRLDTDELWEPHSGDSFEAFVGRHGDWNFDLDWREMDERDRAAKQRAQARQAEYARQLHERWEAERRKQQLAKQAQADREWEAARHQSQEAERHRRQQSEEPVKAARVYWANIDPAYFTQTYYLVRVGKALTLYGVSFVAGQSYWLPVPVVYAIRGHGG